MGKTGKFLQNDELHKLAVAVFSKIIAARGY